MEHFLQSWGYLAVFILCLLSSMGIPVGAEVAIMFGGVLASGQLRGDGHPLNLALVIGAATAADFMGSYVGYAIGAIGGRPLVDRLGKFVLLTHKDLDRAEAWFSRRGQAFVLFGRLVPLLRSFVSLAAGLGEMNIGVYTFFTFIGVAIWCSALASVGYSLGSGYRFVLKVFSDAGYVAGALFVLAVIGLFVHRLRVVRAGEDQ